MPLDKFYRVKLLLLNIKYPYNLEILTPMEYLLDVLKLMSYVSLL